LLAGRLLLRSFFLAVLLPTIAAVLVSSCGSAGEEKAPTMSPEAAPSPASHLTPQPLPERRPTRLELPIKVAVTLPLFEDFVRAAGGDHVTVFSLIPQGADPHSYELTEADIERFAGVDFFFINGLGLDSRLRSVIEAHRDEDALVIPFSPNVPSGDRPGVSAEEAGDNPHLWLDPRLAWVYPELVADEFVIYDSVNEDFYNANFIAYRELVLSLMDEIRAALEAVPEERRKLVTYHDSLAHYARRFGLEVAGFVVREPQDTPADGHVAGLVETIRVQGIPAVFAEFGYDRSVMERIGREARVPVCQLYTDILGEPVDTYIEMMRANTAEIVRCLGGEAAGGS
jgi:ABC-type Zn uptake system ZnuABC Zn-binding protein ZnuA